MRGAYTMLVHEHSTESIQLALMPALVFMDELHLTPENTRVFRQWFIDKF